jgi:hypothetical protein
LFVAGNPVFIWEVYMANSATRTVNRKKSDLDYFDALTPEFRRVASNAAGNYDSKWFYTKMRSGFSAQTVAAIVRKSEVDKFSQPVKERCGFKWVQRQAPMAAHQVMPFYDTRAAPEYA